MNAPDLNDGTAVVLMISAAKAKTLNLPVLAKSAAYANAGVVHRPDLCNQALPAESGLAAE